MSLSLSARDTMLNALTITQISAHTGFPGSTGASEVSGGTYAKVAVTFAVSSGG